MTVFCFATGPSLTQEDVDLCRGKGVCVAVNDAHRLAPWADWLWSNDRYWWGHYSGVPEFKGKKGAIEHTPGRHCKSYGKWGVQVFRNTGHHGVETEPDGVRTCGQNSGGSALNLAVHLGARRIVMLGYNCGVPENKRHFFGDHPSPLSNRSDFVNWRRAFETMRAPLEALGIEVLNCTPNTSISAFQTADLRDVL